MKDLTPSSTALGSALLRAAHWLLDEPKIFRDDFAFGLSEIGSAAALRTAVSGNELMARGINPYLAQLVLRHLRILMALRSRYTEDALARALERDVRQYVILGAGLDSFAYRRPDLAGILHIFEVDHPATQQRKRTRLHELGVALPPNLTFVPVDFEKQMLIAELRVAGYRPEEQTFFSWLGVVPYLTEGAIFDTLREVAFAAAGSEIVCDYVLPPRLLDEDRQQAWLILSANGAACGEPLRSSFAPDHLVARVKELGFAHVWDLSAEEALACYGAGHIRTLGVHLLRARVGSRRGWNGQRVMSS